MREVRRLVPSDFDQYYETRLAALVESPAAYATDAEAWRTASRSTIERHLQRSADEPGSPILGAWEQDDLIGLVGISREQRPSVAHKAGLWGWHVRPEFRHQGVGRSLVTAAISAARTAEGLRQLRAVVPASGAAALSLLESEGFKRFGLEPDARRMDTGFVDQVYLWYLLEADRV
ncbi:MAG TPA: N-acetyltransferase [Actinomycetota bacterium]|nr:N-acetyltransferase [Actinomycetota bacterium]